MSDNYYGTKYTNKRIGYTNEFRQWLANEAELLVQSQLISLDSAYKIVAKKANVNRNTVRRAHNALANAPQARHRYGEFVMPILESKITHGKYTHEDRYKAMRLAIETSVPKAAKKLKISPHSIYDWIKAYGFSSAYFNR
jgi:transposase-like protein